MASFRDTIFEIFPNIDPSGLVWASEPDDRYNCIAWAAGFSDQIWQYTKGYKWPANKRHGGIEALQEVFETIGYELCEHSGLEAGYEKVALYASNKMWTHAARQMSNGLWTSKMGAYDDDIQHTSPKCLNSHGYGNVFCIMRRPIEREGQ